MRRKMLGRDAPAAEVLWGDWPWPALRIRALNSTGTIVNDNTRLASSETITDTDSGENRYFAVPWSKNTGTNTMQIHSVDRNVGTPTSPAPWMIASCRRWC